MADQYRRKALMNEFGIEEEDPNADMPMPLPPDTGIQQTQPEAGPMELGAQPTPAAAAPSWSKGANAGKNSGMILGFDTAKLGDPNSGSAAGSKYTKAAKTFSGGLTEDVGVSRGGLGNMLNYVKANGFPNAQVVGDDKIDFGDGMGPIDVIRSDGQIVFQNTTGNPIWEGQGFKPDANSGALGQAGAGGADPSAFLGGGNPLDAIRAEIAKLIGGNSRPNLQALLSQFGGGQ
jgi:hypothetical protein